jgi:general secretion pathway protein D
MKHYFPKKHFAALLALGLSAAQLYAGGGGGGFGGAGGGGIGALLGGGGGGGAGARGRSSSGVYAAPGSVGDATFSINPQTRSIIAIADEKTQAYIKQVIESLDAAKPQVQINVVFIEVTHNNTSDIGIEGGWGNNIGGGADGALTHSFGMGAVGMATNTAILQNMFGQPASSFAAPGAGLYTIQGQNYNVTLRAIAQSGKGKILSRPSIVVRNNQPATITVGQSVPLITSVRFDNYGNAINSVSYTSIGIILQVTPFINKDGTVEMILTPEISDLVADRSQWVPISSGSAGNAAAPLINQRSADTVVCVPDRQTVIIGGLIANAKADSETKIPVLGDIPLVGNLFKRKTKSDVKTELIIMLTPTIINNTSQLVALSAHDKAQSPVAKGLTDEEQKLYLGTLPKLAAPAQPKASEDSK